MEKVPISSFMFITRFLVDLCMFVAALLCASHMSKQAGKVLIILRNCPKEDFYDTEVIWL